MSEINHKDRAHSKIGASSSERWFNCPASVPLSTDVVQSTSFYAEEGTCAHELAEYCLEHELDAVHGVGLEFNGIQATLEMAEAVQVYLEAIRSRCTDDTELIVEEKFYLDWIDEDLFGSNDCCIVDHAKGKITILDYKHGRGKVVEAYENPQLMYYALGALKGYENIFSVDLVIVQPRAEHPDGPVRVWETDVERLQKFEVELKEAVKRVREAEKSKDKYVFASSGAHCQFCPASGFCEKLRNQSYEVAMVEFEDEIVDPISPENLTPEQLTKVLTHASIIESWLKAVRAHAHAQAEKGVTIPGMKLVKARANRKWKDESQVISDLGMILDDDSLYTKKLISPAQAEKILGKGSVNELTEVPDKGTQLVSENDKRPAVQTAIDMFDL